MSMDAFPKCIGMATDTWRPQNYSNQGLLVTGSPDKKRQRRREIFLFTVYKFSVYVYLFPTN